MSPDLARKLLEIADPGLRVDALNSGEVIQEGEALARYAVQQLARNLAIEQSTPPGLLAREAALYSHMLQAVNEWGRFLPTDARYSPTSWADERCDRCLFWRGQQGCALIKGEIAPGGLCRWHLGQPHRHDAAGNRVFRYQGLKIGTSHAPGDRRFALAPPMRAYYGTIHRSWGHGEDGKALDCYVAPDFDPNQSTPIFRVTQRDPATGLVDEYKYMIGYDSPASAKSSYCYHAGEQRFGAISAIPPSELDRYRADSLWHADACGCEGCDRRKRTQAKARPAPDDDADPDRLRRDGWLGQSLRLDADPDEAAGTWLRDRALRQARPLLTTWRAVVLDWVKGQGSLAAALQTLDDNPADLLGQLDVGSLRRSLYEAMLLGTLSGWESADQGEGRLDALLADSLRMDAPQWQRQSFQEAIAYFRQKTAIPVDTYNQLQADYHDWAFSVAHLTRADLLEAARWLIDRAIADGVPFETFTKQWNRLIGRRGWQPTSPTQLWTIFDTNVRGAIGAGRYQQMTTPAMLARRPIWVWRWRDSPNPREEHEKLHMKGIRADHPFWRGLRVPAGHGCRCGIFAVSEAYAAANGIEILADPPAPSTIADPGFRVPFNAESPYGGRDRESFLSEKLTTYSPAVRRVLQSSLP